METAEAEAVLMALIPLEWKGGCFVNTCLWFGKAGHLMYMIESNAAQKSFTVCRRDKTQDEQNDIKWGKNPYRSLEAAKIACEHHHRTGKWD
jgi:hypothetical protein